jgi:flagellar protein FlbD
MIPLTRFDGSVFYLNAALLVTVEEAPDTVVHLTTGTSLMVKESVHTILDLIVQFQRRLHARTD